MIRYAILGDYARVDGEVAHIMGAHQAVTVPVLPVAHPFALLIELAFAEEECGIDHKIFISSVAPSGHSALGMRMDTRSEWPSEPPPGGRVRVIFAIIGLLSVAESGDHQFVVTLDDGTPYVIDYRVVAMSAAAPPATSDL